MINQPLIRNIRAQFALDWNGIHGAPHWARVRANGLRLAESTGARVPVVELFASSQELSGCVRRRQGNRRCWSGRTGGVRGRTVIGASHANQVLGKVGVDLPPSPKYHGVRKSNVPQLSSRQHLKSPPRAPPKSKTGHDLTRNPLISMVGVKGFEPSTPCTPCKCATRLRHTPILR